ncbi:MAG: AraC family transcriptional regulator [Eubacteriales bacterium]|nr:AraC family transcriptional regulator [Eubacteriales bacterium]
MYKNFLHKIMRIITIVVISLLLLSLSAYMILISMLQASNIDAANLEYCKQIATAMEMILGQSADQTYRFILNDTGMSEAISRMRDKPTIMADFATKVTQILVSDRYYDSVLVYSQIDDWIYSSANNSFQSTENYEDQQMLDKLNEGSIAVYGPRLVQKSSMPGTSNLLYSLIVPIRLNSADNRCMLVVNVDIGTIFKNLLVRMDDISSSHVFIASDDGTILLARDYGDINKNIAELEYNDCAPNMYKSLLSGAQVCYHAEYDFDKLGWHVHLYQLGNNVPIKFINIWGILLTILFTGTVLLFIAYLCLRKSMHPVSELAMSQKELALKEAILSPGTAAQEPYPLAYNYFFIILYETPENVSERALEWCRTSIEWPVDTEKYIIRSNVCQTMMLVCYADGSNADFWRQWLCSTHERMEKEIELCIPMTISTTKQSGASLAEAYQESQLLMNYTMQMDDERILFRADVSPSLIPHEYPESIERQLCNNLVVGDDSVCQELLAKFEDIVFDKSLYLQDNEMIAWVIRMQNALLLQAASIPLRLPADMSCQYSPQDTRAGVMSKLNSFTSQLFTLLTAQVDDDGSKLEESVFEYIDQTLADENFNLTAVLDAFSISRNQLAHILKRRTDMTFNEYVNHIKVERACKLLEDKTLTIDSIAHQVGFTYSHYFIKVFKMIEGVTPGQYRERITQKGMIAKI